MKNPKKKTMTTMNLSLKKSNYVLLVLFLLLQLGVAAQKNSITKLNFYATVGTVFNGSFNSSNSSETIKNKQTYKQYQDSISNKETWRLTYNIAAGFIYKINRALSLQAGIGYLVLGHQRQLKNLQYLDATFPGIGSGLGNGRILDRTSTERNIDLNYRYQYLQIPITIHYQFDAKRPHKINTFASLGLGINTLLKHDINAVLSQGYTIDSEKEFFIDSTGYSANRFSANLMLGMRFDYNYTKELKFTCQPQLGIFPGSVSSNQMEARPWYFNFSVGVIYTLDKLE
jgi:hypothetical protein